MNKSFNFGNLDNNVYKYFTSAFLMLQPTKIKSSFSNVLAELNPNKLDSPVPLRLVWIIAKVRFLRFGNPATRSIT